MKALLLIDNTIYDWLYRWVYLLMMLAGLLQKSTYVSSSYRSAQIWIWSAECQCAINYVPFSAALPWRER